METNATDGPAAETPAWGDWLRRALGLPDGETPFPWQEDLLLGLLKGKALRAVDIPTGLGKTSVMAIWLVARACGADVPRRLVYVVDRRAVVDQATDVAVGLREFVENDPAVKQALGLAPDRALPISTLRGRFVDNREWLADPSSPAIVVGTVDMIGSRLLFEGYRVSRKMRPYHAGLLGADTLVVLDEAHLVPPFEHLVQDIATSPVFRPDDGRFDQLVPRLRLLTLSATGRAQTNVLRLTPEDIEHPIVAKRLSATKSLRIELLDEKTKLAETLANCAWRLAGEGKKPVRVLVYSDSRDVAQKAKAAVEKFAEDRKKTGAPSAELATELFVGARRVFEREAAKQRLAELGFVAGSNVPSTCPAFLFATSAGEVGVDLDADHMVCDLVAWERMVQRLGRVNRRGDGNAQVIVLVEPEPESADKLLTKNPGELSDKEQATADRILRARSVTALIKQLPRTDGGWDVSPGALDRLRQAAEADPELERLVGDAITAGPLRPALTRPLVEAWSMTSLEKHTGRPEIGPWLRGWIKDDPPQTAVVWRTHLPVRPGGPAPSKEEIEAFFEAAPPHTSELLETEADRVVRWVAARAKSVLQQQGEAHRPTDTGEPGLSEQDVVAFVLDPAGGLRQSLALAKLEHPEDKKQFERLIAGATMVVDARLAGLKDGLLDKKEASSPRTADDDGLWVREGAVGFRVRAVEAGAAITKDTNWRERLRFASETSEDGDATRWFVVEKWRQDAATEDDRSAATPQLLEEHQSAAEGHARRLAKALGLDDGHTDVLALAARLHDEGKRAARWQRAFNAPVEGVYAKTEGPINYRLLDGYRHELGSLLRTEDDERIRRLSEEDRDLVLHLIVAHHGFARPVIGTGGCEDLPPSALEEKAAEVALRFARLQARWGPWGLAWWETLLRAADQHASRDAAGGGA
ncbi:MAG TPA: type I-U CRISPR-associated helicase/endonuclease Cas3 [Planctomycetota bacterium]|nr:type I-U CRISPR-associated helicase/endonuclease Cas3 [Planctomycetota bacterium]